MAVGSEILLGSLVDTNTAWLSRRLAALGVAVYRHRTVGDNKERLIVVVAEAASRADLVVLTGGLGPTADDLTHEALGQATGREMIGHPEARRHVDAMFEHFTGRRPPTSAYKQALFPEGSELIANPLGTAMGALLETGGTLFATLPGVPAEMKRMFEEALEPLIEKRTQSAIVSLMLLFGGISEEEMSEAIRDLLLGSHARSLGGAGRARSGRGPPSPHNKGLHPRGGRKEYRTPRRRDPLAPGRVLPGAKAGMKLRVLPPSLYGSHMAHFAKCWFSSALASTAK